MTKWVVENSLTTISKLITYLSLMIFNSSFKNIKVKQN
jgi:hypothetical protein